MNLPFAQLSTHLKQSTARSFYIHGDEALLVNEAADQIRSFFRAHNFTERNVYNVDKQTDWSEIFGSANNFSLFAESKWIELKLGSTKPNEKSLQTFIANLPDDTAVLLIGDKLDKSAQSTKWFKALDLHTAIIEIWPISLDQFKPWLQKRLQQHQLTIDHDAFLLLSDNVEGNLLAASQEIEKLKLLNNDTITLAIVKRAVSDSSRYTIFDLTDAALKGDAVLTTKVIQSLRAEGTEAAIVLWGLAREVRLIYNIRAAVENGEPLLKVMQRLRVFKQRQSLVQSAYNRIPTKRLYRLLIAIQKVDQSIKGMSKLNNWQHLHDIAFTVATGRNILPAMATE